MAEPEKLTTIRSAKGQVTLPEAIREKRDWHAGTRLIVEETPEGVLLRRARAFPETRPEDVRGSLRYEGPPRTLEEMNAAIAEIKRRHARGRY